MLKQNNLCEQSESGPKLWFRSCWFCISTSGL